MVCSTVCVCVSSFFPDDSYQKQKHMVLVLVSRNFNWMSCNWYIVFTLTSCHRDQNSFLLKCIFREDKSVIARITNIWATATAPLTGNFDSVCLEHGKFSNLFTKLIRIKLNDIHAKYTNIMVHKMNVHLFCLSVRFLFYDCYTLSIGQIFNPFWLSCIFA